MHAIKLRRPDRRLMRDAKALIKEADQHDGTSYSFPEDADMYCFLYNSGSKGVSSSVRGRLMAAGYIYSTYRSIDDVSIVDAWACTRPEYRHRGCFNELMRRLGLYGGEPKAIRFQVYDNPDCRKALDRLNAEHEYDELMLSLVLGLEEPDASEFGNGPVKTVSHKTDISSDADKLSSQAAAVLSGHYPEEQPVIDDRAGSCENRYSRCYYRLSGDGRQAYVYGVLTYEQYQRQGHAERLLRALFRALYEQGTENVCLQAASTNTAALKLYEKLGMKETERLSYYICLW